MSMVIATIVVLAIIGLVIGYLLVTAGEKFKVEVDPRETEVRELLPGANCGACGYAGCDALAAAIAKGEAPTNACSAASSEAKQAIADVMGVAAAPDGPKNVAYVKCSGACGVVKIKSNYIGVQTCEAAASNTGKSGQACQYGCLGFGSCTKVCPYDAIHVVNGLAVVDRSKCVACGKCVATCPQHIIEIIPDPSKYAVQCSSNDKGPAVKAACTAGCIGCGLCVRQCKDGAISLNNNVAHIDQSKCTGCGSCAAKCPVKIIHMR